MAKNSIKNSIKDILRLWIFFFFTYFVIRMIFNLLFAGCIDLRCVALLDLFFISLGQGIAFWFITGFRKKGKKTPLERKPHPNGD